MKSKVEGQRTDTPKAANAPNNLFEPIAEYDTTTGDFSSKTIPSFLEWFDFHPIAKWGGAVGISAIVLLAAQVFKDTNSLK